MDPGARDVEFEALRRVGQGIGSVSNMLGEMAQQKQQVVNEGHIAEAKARAIDTEQEVENEIAQEQDYTKWKEISENKWSQLTKETEGNETYSPLAKGVINEFYIAAQARSNAKVSGQVAKREIETANANHQTLATRLRKAGDLEGAEAELQKINMRPEAKAQLIESFWVSGAYEDSQDLVRIASGDVVALRDIQANLYKKVDGEYVFEPKMARDDRRSVERRVKEEISKANTALYNELALGIENGDLVDPEEIRTMEADGRLSAGQAKAYLNAYHSAKNVFDPITHATLRRKITGYDPTNDPMGEEYSMLLGEVLGQPKEVVASLKSELEKQLDGTGQTQASRRVNERLKNMFNSNFFSGGLDPIGEDEVLDAEMNYLKVQEDADRLLNKYPDKSASDIMGMLFASDGSGGESIARHASTLVKDTQTPSSGAGEKKEAGRNAYLRYLQKQFPAITAQMSFREAVKAAAGEKGLTPDQMQRLKDFYGD